MMELLTISDNHKMETVWLALKVGVSINDRYITMIKLLGGVWCIELYWGHKIQKNSAREKALCMDYEVKTNARMEAG